MSAKNSKKPFLTVFEDETIIVINKSPGYYTVADRKNTRGMNVLQLLNEKYDKMLPIHRLDRDTSGLLIFAKHEEAQAAMGKLFAEYTIDKHYLALVEGVPDLDQGLIDAPIAPSSQGHKMLIKHTGKMSQTQYRIKENLGKAALLEAKLLTTRTHQVRIHLSYIGHPLLVDPIYGTRDELFLSHFKKKYNLGKDQEEKPILKRLSLHASLLRFVHPFTNEEIELSAELPKDMRATFKQLKKIHSV